MSQENSARKGAYHRANRAKYAVALAFILSFLAACDSGGSSNPPPVVPPPPPAAAIPGDANALLKDAIRDVDVGDRYTAAEVSIDSNSAEIIRTKLEIAFRNDARLGEVNDLLATLNAQVTSSLAGVPGVVIRIPDPGSLAALDTIVGQIESSPIVWFVRRAKLPATNALPVNIDPAAANPEHMTVVRHHIGVRAPAAWNLAARAESTPAVLVMDYFGNGPPNEDLAYQYLGDAAADFADVSPPDYHGYHVTGIIAARYGGGDTARGLVTGMMPRPVRLSVIDLKDSDPLDAGNRLLLRATALASAETVVINTSLNGGVCNTSITCFPLDHIVLEGGWWAIKVQTLGLEDRVLHLTSAGNIKSPFADVRDAQYNSGYSTAALSEDMVDFDGTPIPRLQNTLAIENVTVDSDIPFANPCLSSGSFHGGHLAGVGSGVWSFTDAAATAKFKSGTSMATPQVAGLSAYLLAIDPTLSPQQIISILKSTARAVPIEQHELCSTHPAPAPLIDAYAAVLALDSDSALDGGNLQAARMRGELLDRDHDGAFDEDDLQQILLQLDMGTGIRDYGPWDLNGDGLTGADGRDTFDLNLDRFRAASGVTQTILGAVFNFDETALTDVAILCYYAYSSLYTGSAEARDLFLEPYRQLGQCGEMSEYSVSATLQGRMFAGVPVPLVVTVNDRNGAVEGAGISVTAEGGSAGGGVTDAAGRMESSATIDADAEFLTLTISVAVDGEVVGERVLRAERALPAIAGGAARVPCCSLSNLTGGVNLSPPGGTVSHAVVPSRTITWTWDPGVSPEEPTYRSKMQRFTATGHDVQLQVSFGSLSASDDDPTYLSLVVETTGPAPRNAYTLFDCPSGTPWETGWPSGACVYVAGNIELFIGGQVVPPPGNPGTVELLRNRSYTLVLYTGSIAGDSFNLDMLFSRDAAAPVD